MLKSITLGVLTDRVISNEHRHESLSVGAVASRGCLSGRRFGAPRIRRTPLSTCETCTRPFDECPGHLGHIELPFACYREPSGGATKVLVNLLNVITPIGGDGEGALLVDPGFVEGDIRDIRGIPWPDRVAEMAGRALKVKFKAKLALFRVGRLFAVETREPVLDAAGDAHYGDWTHFFAHRAVKLLDAAELVG